MAKARNNSGNGEEVKGAKGKTEFNHLQYLQDNIYRWGK